MIREVKAVVPLLHKNVLFRLALVLFFGIFCYLFYGLYGFQANPFLFLSNSELKTNDFLLVLSKNSCPLFFYLFALLFAGDVAIEFLKTVNPIVKVRDKGVLKRVSTHSLLMLVYAVIIVGAMWLFYKGVSTQSIAFDSLIFSSLMIALSLAIVSFFSLLNLTSIGYVFNVVVFSAQPFITVSSQAKNLFLISLMVLLGGVNYFCCKYKENI